MKNKKRRKIVFLLGEGRGLGGKKLNNKQFEFLSRYLI